MSDDIKAIQIRGSRTVTGYFCGDEPTIEIEDNSGTRIEATYIFGWADLEALAAMIDQLLKSKSA